MVKANGELKVDVFAHELQFGKSEV